MAGLITSLLELSRVTSRAAPFARVHLAEVVAEVAVDLDHRLTETAGRLEVGTLPEIRADRQQMRQLFQNLVANALKFRDPARHPIVRVHGHRVDDRRWMIEVTDNGIGFDEKYLDRMFKPFSRLNSTSAYEGSGMGLAICRKIAARHHGEITARSKPGEGSSFIVIIPEREADGAR